MLDLQTITTVINGIKGAMDIATTLKNSNVTLEQAENQAKLAEIISALSDAKIHISQLNDSISEQNNIIKELENKLKQKEEITFNGKVYESKNNKNDIFCPACYDSNQKLVRLTKFDNDILNCKVCLSNYH